jgi:hypothetical protein
MNDPNTTMSDYEHYSRARAQVSAGNKGAVFDVLAATNISLVIVEFDGEGDDGQIKSAAAFRGEECVDLPVTTVTLQQFSGGDTEPVTAKFSLHDAIEMLCYDYLEDTHSGWENSGGAYGEFHLDVIRRTVELEFNARFTDIFTSNHTF